MPKHVMPPDQNIKNAKRKEVPHSKVKTPRVKLSNPAFPTSEGDLGILRVNNPNIPRMVKAPTKTQDNTSHAMSNVMKKAGMLY